jgi:hypothetical protein
VSILIVAQLMLNVPKFGKFFVRANHITVRCSVFWSESVQKVQQISSVLLKGADRMDKPHPHKDLIIAWANGATIQYYHGPDWRDVYQNAPTWCEAEEYRVKPEPKFTLNDRVKVNHPQVTEEWIGVVVYSGNTGDGVEYAVSNAPPSAYAYGYFPVLLWESELEKV